MVYTLNVFNFNQVADLFHHSQDRGSGFKFNTVVQFMDAQSIKGSLLSFRFPVPAFHLGDTNLCHSDIYC